MSKPFNSPVLDSIEVDHSKRILVIGAGMSGMLMAIQLIKSGRSNLAIFEKANQLGGTWRDNVYPGLKCDVPAAMFSYSFAPNTEYSSRFPSGGEIQEYLLSVAQRFQLAKLIQFSKEVESIRFEDGAWQVQTNDSAIESFDIVINATGILHHPHLPDIAGRGSFQGPSFHTARWNASINLTGMKVGVIGSGATAVQIVPELVKSARHVTLFQRSAQWIFPMPNKKYSQADRTRLREVPGLIEKLRYRYSKLFMWTFSRAVIGNAFLLWAMGAYCRNHLHRKVRDLMLRKKLTPKDKCGCKRLIFAKGFYESLQKPNASLCTEAIACIVPQGIQTSDGTTHELDVLIYATGFEVHKHLKPMNVIGRAGKTIAEAWAQGATSYRSTAVPGFPNFFVIFGPYSPIGNYSAFTVAELQVGHIIRVLDHLKSVGHDFIEPTHEATDRRTHEMNVAMKKTVWMSGCKSWYQDSNGNTPMWPWTFERYEKEMSNLVAKDFQTAARSDNRTQSSTSRSLQPQFKRTPLAQNAGNLDFGGHALNQVLDDR